ncbi:MAG: MBL fold metallo-hydrolase RNA specificity domain-containing protein [Candidatus Nitrosocaldaceae archaeon]
MHKITQVKSGIVLELDNMRIALDPNSSIDAELTFISHAHSDHMHMPNKKSSIIASRETVTIARRRGYDITDYYEVFNGLQLINSGHVLGSKALFVDGILYTSDICIRDRAFLQGARLPKCDILIIESTYGKEGFVFPSIEKVCEQANNIISKLYSNGVPVILLGYSLGKAQILTSLFKHWKPLYVYDSIHAINQVYKELGVDLVDALPYSFAEEEGLLKKRPWLMIAPIHGYKFIAEMKSRYSAVTIAFTGWSLSNRYSYYDYTLPLSDHCDFNELLKIVRECNPRKIYTFHGYSSELSSHLNRLGYTSEPLVKRSKNLLEFI